MRTVLAIFILIVFCSCGSKKSKELKNSETAIEIDLLSKPKSTITELSEIASKIDYIPLQTMESSLIGPLILKIVNMNNRIYINCGGMDGEILCFDIKGKFLVKLKNKGRGPQEYTSVTDFDISSDNKIMTVLSGLDRKMLVYGISDTGFIFRRSLTLKDPAPWKAGMVPGTDKVFLPIAPWTGTEPTLSLLINTSGDTIYCKPNCYKYEKVRSGSMAINEMVVYSIDGLLCFKEEFSDTVFYVDEKENLFIPRMIFDSHGTFFTPEMKGGSEIFGNNTTYIANIFETSRYVFCWSGTTDNQERLLFDKKTNTKYMLDTEKEYKTRLKDDLSGGPDFTIEFTRNYCSGGKLFSFADVIALKKYVSSEEFKNLKVSDPRKKDDLKKLADSLNETDNPVLIIVTPKD